ncbi:MAG TPA: hypothetical protein VGM92_04270 [Candidatus Kapabacteria bacterium]|jgi:hypothetical protein
MKWVLFVVFAFALSACSVAPPVASEHMIIVPNAIAFSLHSTDSTISITHSCTCPFWWSDSVYPTASWLTFPTYQSGDKTDVPITIDTSKLPAGTSHATILIESNSYGIDSILVTANK